MREMSVTEQRYKAVLSVIGDGRTVTEVSRDWGVSRQTMHAWLERYEDDGLEGLGNALPAPDVGGDGGEGAGNTSSQAWAMSCSRPCLEPAPARSGRSTPKAQRLRFDLDSCTKATERVPDSCARRGLPWKRAYLEPTPCMCPPMTRSSLTRLPALHMYPRRSCL